MMLRKSLLFMLVSFILFASCNSSADEEFLNQSNGDYVLTCTFSFGSEIGDSLNMIGSINGLCLHPDSSILVLDRVSSKIRNISLNGVSTLFGRRGEAPGEMLFPQSICSLLDGRILVADEMKQEVMSFNSKGVYLGPYFVTERYAPLKMLCVDSSSIVASHLKVDMGENSIKMSYSISRFNESFIEAVTYLSYSWDFPSPELYTQIELIDFTVDRAGHVFVVEDNTEYEIKVFSPEGEYLRSFVSSDLPRITKTQEDIQYEISNFESWARQDEAYTGGYQPAPFHQLISLSGVDWDGNLWVRKFDTEDTDYLFDVWDIHGRLLYQARCNRLDNNNLNFYVDENGIIAAYNNTDTYPQVFRFVGAFINQ